jgi:hypothetical protein
MKLPKRSELNLIEWINRLNPKRCRLVARDGKRPRSSLEIALKSGLSLRKVERLSVRETWAGVPIETIMAFREGCGITMANENRHIQYLVRTFAESRRPLYHVKGINRKLRKRLLS